MLNVNRGNANVKGQYTVLEIQFRFLKCTLLLGHAKISTISLA